MDPIHHSGPLSSATFSPDGQYILTSSWDGIASLWTLPAQIPGTTWQDHRKGLHTQTEAFSANCLAANSTETQLASGSEAGTVIFSSTVKPGIIRAGPTNQDGANLTGQYDFKIPVQTIAWRRSTTQVGLTLVDVESVPPRGSAALLDASTQSLLWRSEVHQGIPWFGEFSPDGLGFVSVADDSTAVYINSQDGSVQNRLDLGRREPELTRFTDALGKCAMHPLDCQIALPARNNRVYLWSPRKSGSSAVEEWRLRLPALSTAWSPDGSRLGIGMESGGWEIRKSASGEIMHSGDVQSDIRRVTFSSDGELVALGGEDGTVTVVRLGQTRPLAVFKSTHKGVTSLQFLRDSKFLMASSRGGEVALWALDPPILANELFHFPSAVDRLVLCESRDCIFATCRDGVVRRIQLERGKKSLPEPLEDWLLRLFTGDLPAVEKLNLRLHPSQQTHLSELLIRKK
jgi:WD40 repeat protein